ncbi:hypothetical protein BP6252_09456 [Coleophoma cylindrospora]|uniref:Transmembrane protein n=1 Tax=Coleophoma cylindrospora TaxID=1849047 RepID=A0A3D8R288_9HELO|nr:hypothetical protein BP6252_09456 [Coleophoma cylindrospora]
MAGAGQQLACFLAKSTRSLNLGLREKELPAAMVKSKHYQSKTRHTRERYLVIVTLCLMASIVSVVLEAFALFNIEYCDGEDLMQLFWGFWSILQVGSIIAIFGVMLQFWIVLGSHEHPSWGVALGTPVLVFAAFAWIVRAISLRAWARLRGRAYQDADSDSSSSEEEEETNDEEKGTTSSRWRSQA